MASFQFCVNGQRLTASERYTVGGSVNYLDAVFVFSDDWGEELRKTAHFTKDGAQISRIINDGIISKADGLNLSAGLWKITVLGEALDGDEYVERITTNAVTIRVNNEGVTDGEPFPEMTPSIGEQIVERATNEADRSEAGARDAMIYAAHAISAAEHAQGVAYGLPEALEKYIEEHAEELKGEDGFSPLVNINQTPDDVTITITDKTGAHVATIPTGGKFQYVELHTVWRGNHYEIADKDGNIKTFAEVVDLFNDPDTFVYCVSSNIVHLPSFKEVHGFAFIGAYSINNEWHLTRVIINDTNEVKLTDAQTPTVDDVTMLIFEYLGDYATKAELSTAVNSLSAGLAKKMTAPDTGLEVGKYFRVVGIDDDGKPVLEYCDLPIATADVFGVVKQSVSGLYGVTTNTAGRGVLAVNGASDWYLNNRNTNDVGTPYRPVCVNKLDDAVRLSMTDGKGAEWTEAEQLSARQRLGIDKEWVLKGTLTTENKDSGVNVDLSGCTELMIKGYGTATGNTYLYANGTSKQLIYAVLRNGTITRYALFKDVNNCLIPLVNGYQASEGMLNRTTANNLADAYINDGFTISQITKLNFNIPSNVISCNIEIYGR